MGYLVIAAQFFLSLSFLIILHEMGHFFPARWFNTRVEKFFLFFDVKGKIWSKQIGETEYGIGWLPLGGYVKISGMIDESMDTDQMESEPQPWEYRSKPAWQRLIIILGGVTVNFILGFLIFAMLLWQNGETFIPADQLPYGIAVNETAAELGLKDGDDIIRIGDKPMTELSDGMLIREIVINNAEDFTVKRGGNEITVPIGPQWIGYFSSAKRTKETLFAPRIPFKIDEVTKNKPAAKAGFKTGDQIVSINGKPAEFIHLVNKYIGASANQEIAVSIKRNGQIQTLNVTPDENGLIGIRVFPIDEYMTLGSREYGFIESFPAGVKKGLNFLDVQIKAFGQMFKGKMKASDSLGGFGTIAKLFPSEWDWTSFWNTTAILSLILGFFNVLPIPALDGGHAMFILYEMVTGRKASDKVVQVATMVGMALLLSLFLYANGLDIMRSL